MSTPHVPQLSAADLRYALEELDAKIKTLHNRAHATAAGSTNTYEAHATALEAKRARLAEQLGAADTTATPDTESGIWTTIRRGISDLDNEVRSLL